MNIFNELEKKFNNQNELKNLFDFNTYQQYQDIKKQEIISIKNALKIANKLNLSLDYIYIDFLENEIKDIKISKTELEILNKIKKLNQKDQQSIINLINSLSTKEH